MAQTRKVRTVLEYGADYSSSYGDRSIPDKAYVDSVAGGGGGLGSLLHVVDQKTSGTAGAAATASTWNVRVLNTVLTNNISGASLSSNTITLPAGTYYIDAHAGTTLSNGSKARLRNTSDNSTTIVGTSEYGNASTSTSRNETYRSRVEGQFTIASSKNFQLQHWVASANGDFGEAVSSGEVEIYAVVQIWKL